MNQHERGFLTFLAEPARRRMEALLELGEKRRGDVRELLDHAVRLDARFSRRLSGIDAAARSVEKILQNAGAPPVCHIITAKPSLDGHNMPLGAALDSIIGRGHGTFVSCIPGRLGFYEFEDVESSYLLSR